MPGFQSYKEEELVFLLRKGSKEAFTSLYNLYSKSLYINMVRLVKSEETAEELLQEVFVTLWEKRETLDIRQNFSSYLFRIGKNKVYDFFRKLKRDEKFYCQLKAIATEEHPLIEETILSIDNAALLQKAIDILPPQRKQIFQLCKLQGKSYIEVSRQLGISTSTINDHIVKAMRSIREFIYSNPRIALSSTLLTLFY